MIPALTHGVAQVRDGGQRLFDGDLRDLRDLRHAGVPGTTPPSPAPIQIQPTTPRGLAALQP